MSPAVTKELFRQTWGNFPSGVSVVTFYEKDGTVHGLTANSVCSVSLDPFLVLVCVDHKARSYPMMMNSQRFLMSILSSGQDEPCMFFAKSDTEGAPPFSFRKSAHGYPILDGCLAYMDCKNVARHPAGDHDIFVGEVEEIEVYEGKPLVFYQAKFTEVVPPAG